MIESALPISDSDENAGTPRLTGSTAAHLGALADQATALNWPDVPPVVQDRLLLVLFDTLGVMLAGARTSEVQALAGQFREEGASILAGLGRTSTTDASCWVNGASVCALELDEGSKYARGHPAAHVVPAALAVGGGHDGADWLGAVLVGYETAARFGRATRLHPGVHPHGTWGGTGAAAAAGKLAGLDRDGIMTAIDAACGLALAPHFESALTGSPVRNLWVGAANVAGLTAVRLAASGAIMTVDTAAYTFGNILGDFDPEPLAVPFDDQPEILRGYFKRHAACAYTHSAADAALALLTEQTVDPDQVDHITVETYAIAATLNRTVWPTRLAAMFSIPYVVAVTLIDGVFGPDATTQTRREDPAIRELACRVDVKATDEFEQRLPEQRGSRVTVRMTDGSRVSAEVAQPVGDSAHQPLGWNEVRYKLGDLIGTERTTRLETTVRALPTEPVDVLFKELTRR